jgi:hypothetical protein
MEALTLTVNSYTHNLDSEEDLVSKNGDTKADDTNEENEEDEYFHVKGKNDRITLEMFKEMGNYMRSFSPFYELESMNKIYTPEDIKKKQDDIIDTIQNALRSIRSSQNKNTKLKKDRNTIKKFESLLDIFEDEAAGRFSHHEIDKQKRTSLVSLRKLMPGDYMIEIQPSAFNYFDSERIKTSINEE